MQEKVREQYEGYPYPLRDPSDDLQPSPLVGPLQDLRVINHHCFGGRRDWQAPFRVLVAGGGTGDASTNLGRQLQSIGTGELVYLDLSQASMAVAKQRAEQLGLTNITFVNGSLLEVAEMGLGSFDYINCSGVLHHLADPDAGARALASVLNDDGAMGIMLYGELGRTGIYHAQEMLRMLSGDRSDAERIALARRFLPQLPTSNWLSRNDELKWDDALDDAEVYDRFLHSCDRAYRVPDCIDLMGSAGLEILHFTPGLLHRPSTYLRDPELLAQTEQWPPLQQAAFVELFSGTRSRLSFFAGRGPAQAAASTDDLDAVPILLTSTGAMIADRIGQEGRLEITLGSVTMNQPMQLGPLVDDILRHIDSRTSLRTLYEGVSGRHEIDLATFHEAFHAIYDILHGAEFLMLGHRPD